jgi:polyphosphate kinase
MTPYIDRDISWLSFNYRVLQEAKDKSVPLLERVKFLAIYSSNLDEFFRVRVANHRNLLRAGKKTRKELGFEPAEVLLQLLKIVNQQQEEFSEIFENIIVPELRRHGISIIRRKKMTDAQVEYVEAFFDDNLLPFVQPVLLVGKKIKPFLNNAALYLALDMEDIESKKGETAYAIVKIPSDHVPRFIELPPSRKNMRDIIILDDVVRHSIKSLFPGYHVKDSYSIKLTRDAELYIDDEFSGDLLMKIRKSLNKRNVGPASRLVYDREMTDKFLKFLKGVFDLESFDLLPEGRYHNNSDFFKFPHYNKVHLQETPLPPLQIPELENAPSIFTRIDEQDWLNNVPFHSYESVIKFFEDASVDPHVTHIKIIQYRVAKKSRIMNALEKAVKNGKQVSAFIEIKARFDEEANLIWGERLEQAGVTVYYSIPGLKVHSKLAIVRKLENNSQPKFYAFMSTGNFHEDTAKVYSDIGVFTADERITSEATRLFTYLETKVPPIKPFEHLFVGQFGLKQKLLDLIEQEVTNVQAGHYGEVILKMNSIEDKEMIEALYQASQRGVKIKLIIRGICSIVPGVPGISDGIEAISIVDRFLEHARTFVFHNQGNKKVFLSSADWMNRNLHRRIETVFPIYDEKIKTIILDILKIQLNDNVKARLIDYKKNNIYKKNDKDLAIRSQIETYYYLKRLRDSQSAAGPTEKITDSSNQLK